MPDRFQRGGQLDVEALRSRELNEFDQQPVSSDQVIGICPTCGFTLPLYTLGEESSVCFTCWNETMAAGQRVSAV